MRSALLISAVVTSVLALGPGSMAAATPAVAASTASSSATSVPAPASGGSQPTPAISQAQAVAAVAALFPQVRGLAAPQAQTQTDYLSGQTLWTLNWPFAGQPGTFGPGAFATVDAQTGQVVTANFAPIGRPRSSPMTLAAARAVADAFLAKATGGTAELQAQGPSMSLSGWSTPAQLAYGFSWLETCGGVPISNAAVSLQVNALTGSVTNYDRQLLPQVTFPPASSAVPSDQAASTLLQDAGLVLVYDAPGAVPFVGASAGATVLRPMWEPASSMGLWDAKTGQAMGAVGLPSVAPPSGPIPSSLTLASAQAQGVPATQAQAAATAAKVAQLAGYGNWTPSSPGQGSEQQDGVMKVFWDVQFSPPGQPSTVPNPYQMLDIQISADSGAVQSLFANFPPAAGAGPAQVTDAQQAQDVATTFVQAVDPADAAQTVAEAVYTPEQGAQPTWSTQFTRLYDGIPVATDRLNVTVNGQGQVTNYTRVWHDLTPSATAVRTMAQAAAEKVFAALPVELTYVLQTSPQVAPNAPSQPLPPTLAYGFRDGRDTLGQVYLDASSGAVYGADGLPFAAPAGPPKAIAHSWAMAQLWALDQAGLLPSGAGPNAPVTLGPALRAVLQTLASKPFTVSAGGSAIPPGPYGTVIARAVGDGLLTAQAAADPQRSVTRQEFVAWVVRALGYGPLLSMQNRVSVRFSDAGAVAGADRNAVGIAQGLGIVTGDAAGSFRPSSPATWADLATILMRAAQHETSALP